MNLACGFGAVDCKLYIYDIAVRAGASLGPEPNLVFSAEERAKELGV